LITYLPQLFPGAKIGVLGPNGSGKSTLLKVMAGVEKDFQGEAWAAEGRARGLPAAGTAAGSRQTVMENVMEAMKDTKALLDRIQRHHGNKFLKKAPISTR
jgi:sulfate-transporting ATPase